MELELREVLRGFKNLRIAVIGDTMLDILVQGSIERLNPEQKRAQLVRISTNGLRNRKKTVGGGANVAANIVPFANCDFYGVVGTDYIGKEMESIFIKQGINPFLFFDKNTYTIVKERIFDDAGEYVIRLDYEERAPLDLSDEFQEKIIESLKEKIKGYDAIILSDYKKGIFVCNSNGNNLATKIISLAKSFNLPVICDVKPSNLNFFKGSTVICPNKNEAGEMLFSDAPQLPEELIEAGKKLKERFLLNHVIITRDAEGVFVYSGGKSKNLSAFAKEVSDPTGAGDSLTAGVALGLANGLSIEDSTEFGNMMAGLVVEKPGTVITNPREVLKRYSRVC
jgi:D-beta-D-heptose 7-phosphate kinase / D-beta-D-heptose 1-phosphate adenosyltransferase